MQGTQFGSRVGAETVGEELSYGFVARQCLRGAARVAQGAQAQDLEGLVQGVGVAEGGEVGEVLLGLAEGECRGEAGSVGVEAAGLPAGRLGGAVREVGEGGAAPEREGVVEDDGRLAGVAVGERADALPGEPLEAVQVDVVGRRAQPVAALGGGDRVRAERPAQPAHQGLQRARGVGGRVRAPHLVDQYGRGHGPSRPQGEHGQQGTQPRPADRDGGAVATECLGGAENAVAHGVHCLRWSQHGSRGSCGVAPGMSIVTRAPVAAESSGVRVSASSYRLAQVSTERGGRSPGTGSHRTCQPA